VLYDRIADFVAGKTIVDPQAPIVTGSRAAAGSLTLTGRFPAPRALGGMDVRIDEPSGTAPWTGTAEVRVKGGGDAAWAAGGWAVRTEADARDGRWQVPSVPLDAVASEFEIVLRPFAGARLPEASAVQPDPIDRDEILRHAALGARYAMSPMPEGAYGDTPARLLTDGVVPAKGFSRGQTTGWRGAGDRRITVDLGDMRPVRNVRVWVLRGGRSGICAPAKVSVAGSSNGATWTAPVSARAPEGPAEDGSRCEAAAFEAVFPPGAAARHMRVDFAPGRGWTMVSEIEVQSD